MSIIRRSENALRVYEYIIDHPRSIASQAAKSLDLPLTSVQWALLQLEKEGLVKSKGLIRPKGRGYFIKPYVAVRPRLTPATTGIIRLAKRVGHPFGIAAAQVMA